MSFTHALYYPWIDISDVGWLKNAVLYWDKISTIVPWNTKIIPTYGTYDAYALQDAGILLPFEVLPDSDYVKEASRIFSAYLKTPEASGILLPPGVNIQRDFHSVELEQEMARIHINKVSTSLRRALVRTGRVKENGQWLELDPGVVNYYMSLLAAIIGQNQGWALLTDESIFEVLNNRVRRGDNPSQQKKIKERISQRVYWRS